MFAENENDLILDWFFDISTRQGVYKEPILDRETVRLFKEISDIFEQNTHVFILSIEVAEDYIRAKDRQNEIVEDPVLAAATITFICHKCEGAQECLKIRHVLDVLYCLTRKRYNSSQVTAMEGDILVALEGKLPITTPLDDLDIVIERYVRESRLRVNVRPLCLKILEYIYMERMLWFEDLKEFYSQNNACVIVFQNLFSSRFYLPVSIFVTALKISNYRYILDIDAVIQDIMTNSEIHPDHLGILVDKITEIIN